MMYFLKKNTVHIALLAIIFIMLGGGFWSSGGFLLLDYIAAPNGYIQWFQNLGNFLPQFPVLVFGFEWGTKGTYLGILIISAWLGVSLVRQIAWTYFGSQNKIVEFFGGLFFLINPFAYERMMVQPVIYLGIILLGWTMYFLFFGKNFKKFLWTGMCAGLACNFFLHSSFMIALVFLVFLIFFARKKSDFLGIILAGMVTVLLNLNWILAPFFSVSNSINSIDTFNIANFEAFATQSLAPMNVWFTNIFLYGFWGEAYSNHYASVIFLSQLWFFGGLVVFLLAIFGFYKIFTKKFYSHFYAFLLIFAASLIFGIGIASPLLRDFTLFMAEYIPFWAGYREPQKWIGLVMIIEGIAFIVALLYIFEKLGKDIIVKISAIISIFLLLYTWSPGPFFGYQGQLRTTAYPQEFENLRTTLLQENFSGKILALPWHSYVGCTWMGRPTISNPISGLLSPLSVKSSNNIEIPGVLYSNNNDLETVAIENFIKNFDFEPLREYHFSHILLMKQCASSAHFEKLDGISQCQKVEDNDILVFYKCE